MRASPPHVQKSASWCMIQANDGIVGFFGPPHMPGRVREAIAADVRSSMDSVVVERLNLTGQIPNYGGPSEFVAAIEDQGTRLAVAAKNLGIVPTQ